MITYHVSMPVTIILHFCQTRLMQVRDRLTSRYILKKSPASF